MPASYWNQVQATGLAVPTDRPLDELTADLTRMLGDPDPETRDGLAYPVLAAWISRGVYDDLLAGLGDGMAAGLGVGLGEQDTDTVFRRSFSALVLDCCLHRDNEQPSVSSRTVLEWGDRAMTWLLRERDVRGFVPGKGWAHTVAHGADVLGTLADSPHVGAPELAVVLDVLAERVLLPSGSLLAHGEPDRLAAAAVRVLARDLVATEVVEEWVGRLAAAAGSVPLDGSDPFLLGGDAQALLRALHLQLAVGRHPVPRRADLLLCVLEGLKASNPHYLQPPAQPPAP